MNSYRHGPLTCLYALALPIILLISSCSQDIAGLTRNERLYLYSAALTAYGHPLPGAIIYGLRRPVTYPKQPVEVTP